MISCAVSIPPLLTSILVIAGSLLIGLGYCMGRIPKLFAACHDITAPFIPGIICRSSVYCLPCKCITIGILPIGVTLFPFTALGRTVDGNQDGQV